jgi:trimethylamine:corrinoid methyltransferase-like protein
MAQSAGIHPYISPASRHSGNGTPPFRAPRARTLEAYEPPPLDDAIRAELEEYVTRRRAELGD